MCMVKIIYEVIQIEDKYSCSSNEIVLIEYDTEEEAKTYISYRVENYGRRCYIRKVYSK
jgi:hypothetical protein